MERDFCSLPKSFFLQLERRFTGKHHASVSEDSLLQNSGWQSGVGDQRNQNNEALISSWCGQPPDAASVASFYFEVGGCEEGIGLIHYTIQ